MEVVLSESENKYPHQAQFTSENNGLKRSKQIFWWILMRKDNRGGTGGSVIILLHKRLIDRLKWIACGLLWVFIRYLDFHSDGTHSHWWAIDVMLNFLKERSSSTFLMFWGWEMFSKFHIWVNYSFKQRDWNCILAKWFLTGFDRHVLTKAPVETLRFVVWVSGLLCVYPIGLCVRIREPFGSRTVAVSVGLRILFWVSFESCPMLSYRGILSTDNNKHTMWRKWLIMCVIKMRRVCDLGQCSQWAHQLLRCV